MRVDSGLTNPSAIFVPPTTPCTQADVNGNLYGCTVANSSAKGLCKAGTALNGSAATGIAVTPIAISGLGAAQTAAVVFVSHGSTGYGSYNATPFVSSFFPFSGANFHTCNPPNNGFAECNGAVVGGTSRQFYDATAVLNYSVANSTDRDFYDDVLAYADRNTLVSMLGNGACNTTW